MDTAIPIIKIPKIMLTISSAFLSIPPRCHVRGQNLKGRQAGGPPRAAAGKVQPGHQSQDGQTTRHHDSAECSLSGDQGD